MSLLHISLTYRSRPPACLSPELHMPRIPGDMEGRVLGWNVEGKWLFKGQPPTTSCEARRGVWDGHRPCVGGPPAPPP